MFASCDGKKMGIIHYCCQCYLSQVSNQMVLDLQREELCGRTGIVKSKRCQAWILCRWEAPIKHAHPPRLAVGAETTLHEASSPNPICPSARRCK